MKKKIIVVTGGAGFIGSNLIEKLLQYKKFKIISIDNYSSGTKKNHMKSSKVTYLNGDTINIKKILHKYRNNINCIFHFGEFSRIFQSFKKFDRCFQSNTLGSHAVFSFCLNNKIKLIYSATSASLGLGNKNKNLSPYAFSKANNLELLENLKKWFSLKFEIIYFYNVYGKKQIDTGDMATVIGIFEKQYLDKKPLTVVKPGHQSRRFTHISNTIQICIKAWRRNKCAHYSISSRKSYTILQVAKMFKSKIILLPSRSGERYSSALTDMNLSNKVNKFYGSKSLKDYIKDFINNN